MIDVELRKCEICGTCIGVCPVDAIMIEDNELVIDNVTCVSCGACVQICPVEALWEDR